MSRAPFIGAWRLISMEIARANREPSYPLGEKPEGLLIYGEDGYMSVHLMRAGRPAFASADRLRGTDPEVRAAFHGYIAYAGTYDVAPEEQTIIHRVSVSLFPNWCGAVQRRAYSFSGDRLTLYTEPHMLEGSLQTGRLVWERAPGSARS